MKTSQGSEYNNLYFNTRVDVDIDEGGSDLIKRLASGNSKTVSVLSSIRAVGRWMDFAGFGVLLVPLVFIAQSLAESGTLVRSSLITALITLVFISLPCSLYFFQVAKMVKRLRITPNILKAVCWVNISILVLSLIGGIIGIVLLINSILVLSKMRVFRMWFRKNTKKSFPEFWSVSENRSLVAYIALICTGALLLLSLAIFGNIMNRASPASILSNSSMLGSESIAWETFSSYSPRFTVSLPGTPEKKLSHLDVGGISVPYTEYVAGNDKMVFFVASATYPSYLVERSSPRSILEGALNGSVESTASKILSSDNTILFQGYPAISATMSAQVDGRRHQLYYLAFLRGNDIFILVSLGASHAEFEHVKDSFELRI